MKGGWERQRDKKRSFALNPPPPPSLPYLSGRWLPIPIPMLCYIFARRTPQLAATLQLEDGVKTRLDEWG